MIFAPQPFGCNSVTNMPVSQQTANVGQGDAVLVAERFQTWIVVASLVVDYRSNSARIDLDTREITSFLGIRRRLVR
jgi:hypothetical protein